jgi:hypothetical protein
MIEERVDVYELTDGSEKLIAENMSVEDACLLVSTMFQKYFAQPDMRMQIRRRREEVEACHD